MVPQFCSLQPDVECERGANTYSYRWWFYGYEVIAVFLIIVISMTMMCYKVIRQNKLMVRRSINSQPNADATKKKIVKQSALYVAAFFFPIFFPTLYQVEIMMTGEQSFPIWILVAIFMPLQGFFNFIVFVRPRLISLRRREPDLSFKQALLITVKFISKQMPSSGTSSSGMENV